MSNFWGAGQTLGDAVNGEDRKHDLRADLRIAVMESPLYYIVDYDGKETVIGEKDLVSAKGDVGGNNNV